ncbi:MAG TPA: carboxypeptidase regulatory-like domain-containing protein [Bryobacteraceae bacterium]|nr:carboxypeptidase regulatory-like domain-containing protein [Bryobacteraceae bacterium]
MKRTIQLLLLPAIVAAGGFAQSLNTGTFSGSVYDASGAVIPGATIRITSENTAFQRETTADAEGNYQLLQVPTGTYTIEFEREGFQKSVQKGVAISAGQNLRVNGNLTVGSVTETVEVGARVAQVDTTSANVGATVYGSQVQELALTTRSFTQLITLQPGVASNQAQQPGFGSNTSVPFSFNGGQQSSNNWLLDGGRNVDTYNGNNLTMVNLDAIAEVRIERNAYSAEYGRNSGAQVNVITRSGTNQFHGSAFEFFRNDKLDSRNFFATAKPKNRYNNFGWTLGGPIKQDKVFFFLSNEYRRILQTTGTRTAAVPTARQLAGDFSGGRVINDPTTGQPFPNNRIPADRLDPNALALIRGYYAEPTPGFQQGALNFTSSEPDGTKYRSGLGRVDYNYSPTMTFFGRYNIDSTRLDSPYGLFAANSMPGVAASEQAHIMYTANGSMNWTIRPTLLNQFTMSWYHGSMAISTVPFAARDRVPDFGVPRYFDTDTDSAGFIPAISMSAPYAGISILWPQNISHYTWELMDNMSWIKGRHIFKFGGSLSRENKTQNSSNINNNGIFTFNASYSGDALADLLLGRAFSYAETSHHRMGSAKFNGVGLYFQDQYRATNRLTLTAGLRWEFFQPEYDPDGLISYFDPNAFDRSNAAVVLPNNGEIQPGTENFGNGIRVACETSEFGCAVTNTRYKTFAPRVGFSYALTQDQMTVVRGGYGIFHDRWSQFVSGSRNNYPFNQSISIYNTLFSNPAQGTRRIFPSNVTNMMSPWEVPYLQKWSLDLQRQLFGDLVVTVGYVGSKGTHLIRTLDINQPQPSLAIATGQVNPNAVRPYPGFAAITSYSTSADSIYHSLQASGVRRFGGGVSIQASYTWSKSLDNVITPFNIYWDGALNRGISSFDRRHMLIASYIWEIPFAKSTTGWKRKVLDGWQISGISSFQSGNPLTIGITGDRAGTGAGGQRPNLIAPVDRPRELSQWFSTSSFALPAQGTFGNAGRSLVTGPGINNWDVSFSKRTDLTESVSLQFRAEFFNLFNHAQWSGVGTTFGTGTFGQVTSARDPRIGQLGLRLLF